MLRTVFSIERLKVCDWQLLGIIYLSASFVFSNNLVSSPATIALWLVLLLSLFIGRNQLGPAVIYGVLLSSLLLLSSIFNNEELIGSIKVVFSFIVGSIYVQKYGLQTTAESFIKIMYYICLFSIIGFVLTLLIPSLNNLNVVTNKSGVECINWYVFVKARDSFRNFGVFWEPGAFQFHINIALLFLLFLRQSHSRFIIIVYLIALLTTYSTTGYLTFVLILLVSILSSKTMASRRRYVGLIIVLLFVLGYYYRDLLFAASLSTGESTVFGKIFNFSKNDIGMTSASIRYYGVLMPLRLFLDSPLFGHGIHGLSNLTRAYTNGMNTCTFINWFAQFGLIYGLIAVIGIAKVCGKMSSQKMVSIGLFIIVFVSSMSENLATNPFLLMLILAGYDKRPLRLS